MTSLRRDEVIRCAIAAAGHQVPILAGTGTNATASTIDLTTDAKDLGAAAWDKHKRNRLLKELTGLSDEMLLDIGIDPRRIPNPAGELMPRPDLTRSGLATPIWRTAAKS